MFIYIFIYINFLKAYKKKIKPRSQEIHFHKKQCFVTLCVTLSSLST